MWKERFEALILKESHQQEIAEEIALTFTKEQILQEAVIYKKIKNLKTKLMKDIRKFFSHMCKDLIIGVFDNDKVRSRIMGLICEAENKISKIREEGLVWKVLEIKIDDSVLIEEEKKWFLSYDPLVEKDLILNPYTDCERKVYFLLRKLQWYNFEASRICNNYVKRRVRQLTHSYFTYKKRFRHKGIFDLYLEDGSFVKIPREKLVGKNPEIFQQITKIVYRDFVDKYYKDLFIGNYDIGLHLMELEKDEINHIVKDYCFDYITKLRREDSLTPMQEMLLAKFEKKVCSIYIDINLSSGEVGFEDGVEPSNGS